MVTVKRTTNPTHPITLTTYPGSVNARDYNLTEDEASRLIGDLLTVAGGESGTFTLDEKNAVRAIIRDELRDIVSKGVAQFV